MQQGIEKQNVSTSIDLCGAGMIDKIFYTFPTWLLTPPLEIFPI